MFVVVTGTRHASRQLTRACIQLAEECEKANPWTLLIHGYCDGADLCCSRLWDDRGMPQWVIEAPWNQFRTAFKGKVPFESGTRNGRWKLAGPVRNAAIAGAVRAMLQAGLEGRGVAFPGAESKGTWDCVKRLREAGLEVEIREVKP